MEYQVDLEDMINWVTTPPPTREESLLDKGVWYWADRKKFCFSLDNFPEDAVGFVYEIFHKPTGKRYIGKKILKTKRTRPPLKGKKRKRIDYVDSKWAKYTGSNSESKKWKIEDCQRVIHFVCTRKDEMTYLETMLIFERKALIDENYLNDNVLGKFYKKTIKEKYHKIQ